MSGGRVSRYLEIRNNYFEILPCDIELYESSRGAFDVVSRNIQNKRRTERTSASKLDEAAVARQS